MNPQIGMEMKYNLLHDLAHEAGIRFVCCHVLLGPECWGPLHTKQAKPTLNNNLVELPS